MISPQRLKPGDKIAIVATARSVPREDLKTCVHILESWGLIPVLCKHLFSSWNIFAGNDKQRLDDLQYALDDEEYKAILFARGGYGTLRILDDLSFEGLKNFPKWLIGFSDLTPLLVRCHNEGIESIHGPMGTSFISGFGNETSLRHLKTILMDGGSLKYVKDYPEQDQFRTGEVSGTLIGGCISLLHHCIGTQTNFNTEGKILILEDIDEYLYHLDRLFLHLKRAGKFDKAKGVIIGGLTEMKDNPDPFGFTPNEIAMHNLRNFSGPICTGFPIGHWANNFPFVLGRNANYKVTERSAELIIEN